MKKPEPLFLFILVTFLMLSGCKDKNDDLEDVTFEIAEVDLTQDFTQEKQSVNIDVTTQLSDDQWSVASDQPWCLVTKGYVSGRTTILLHVETNEDPDMRNASVTVVSEIKSYIINVRQTGYGPAILVKTPDVTVGAEGGEIKIIVTSNVEYTVSKSENSSWIEASASVSTYALTDHTHNYTVAANGDFRERKCQFIYRYNDIADTCNVTQQAREGSKNDVTVEGDVKIIPTRGEASEHQPNYGIERSFDGQIGNGLPYHSLWDKNAVSFPVRLEYFFENESVKRDIDYIIYHTRSGNGNFGRFDLYYATKENPEYQLYNSYDFNEQNAASQITFSPALKNVTKIKFMVHSGLGGFVSCDEMEFFSRREGFSEQETLLLTVFKDLTCSELNEHVTTEQINSLPSYFAMIAMQLKEGIYDAYEKEFRIRDYEPYSIPEEWAQKLMTSKYSNLDNPTGIFVGDNEEIIVLVGDTHGRQVSLQSIGEETVSSDGGSYKQTAARGEQHILKEGINKLTFSSGGMLFVMYNTDLSSNPQPVRIHIPPQSGAVTGFFDLKTHQTNDKYKELIDHAVYKYFCVRGENIMFYFHTERLKQAVPYDILSAINLWDEIVGWQHELMGISDIHPAQFNNHLFAISPEGSYMWASDYRIAFTWTSLDKILLKDNVMAAKDNAWGPAHEIGHIHQKAINWPGSTESSNNLFSNYTLYKLGKYCSRGSELSALATSRLLNKDGWYNMGDATHQNEDTELHMRMNWQLWNYYHRCGYKPDFWQTLFNLLRENRINEADPGAAQLLFAKMASRAANTNLTEFFDIWGFLTPVNNIEIEQYGKWTYNVTPSMIAEAKTYMAQFPQPKHAFYYLEDRRNGDTGIENYKVGDVGYYTQFQNNTKITKNISATVSGQNVRITNGDEAVAFEVRQGGELLWFSNFFEFTVPDSIALDATTAIYAVQADGERIRL